MKIKNFFMMIAGVILLLLGAIGILIPVWPTTPFVLCAVGCFAGSPRLRAKLLKIRFVKEYFENYQNHTGLSKRTQVSSLLFLWGMLLLSCVLLQKMWLAALLMVIGAGVTAHILWIARWRANPKQDDNFAPVAEVQENDG